MKYILICIVCIGSLSASGQQREGFDRWGYPVFDSVAMYLSDKVNTDSITGYKRLRLAKKKDGWYFYIMDYTPDGIKYSKQYVVWQKGTQKYVYYNSDYHPKDIASAREHFYKALYAFDSRSFNEEPLFGYVGWTRDVWEMYEAAPKLSDAEMEALARAYSTELGYRTGQFGDLIDPSMQFNLGSYPGHMSPAQIDTFRRYNDLACRTFRRLWEQNPKYETFIGNIWLKYSNEVMSGFMTLAFSQSLAEGTKELGREALYDPASIAFAKNLLASCAKDGILFTNGDNDTYPLYYVQAKMNFRRDVLIVNLNLLAVPLYINFLRAGVYQAPGYPMLLDTADYAGTKLDYLYSQDEAYKKFSKVTGIDKEINLPVLYKNNIALIDMLNANKWKRPIYFAHTVATESFMGLDAYLVMHGNVYQLQPFPSAGTGVMDMPLDTGFCYGFFMNKMDTIDWAHQIYAGTMLENIASNDLMAITKTAQAMNTAGRKKECLALLDKTCRMYPADKIRWNVFFINVAELYYGCGEKDKGRNAAGSLLKVAREDLKTASDDSGLTNEEWNKKMRTSLYVFQELSNLYGERGAEDEATAEALKQEFSDAYQEYIKKSKARGIQGN